jgi:hypothetical protein
MRPTVLWFVGGRKIWKSWTAKLEQGFMMGSYTDPLHLPGYIVLQAPWACSIGRTRAFWPRALYHSLPRVYLHSSLLSLLAPTILGHWVVVVSAQHLPTVVALHAVSVTYGTYQLPLEASRHRGKGIPSQLLPGYYSAHRSTTPHNHFFFSSASHPHFLLGNFH